MGSRVLVRALALAAILVAGDGGPRAVTADSATAAIAYVCPPCGCGSDDLVHEKPGVCAACGMSLVVQGSAAATAAPVDSTAPPRRRAAILIFPGVQIIDYTGPYEVFGQAGFEVFTVAASPDPLTTAMGMQVTPRYTLADAPAAEVLLIPGGNVTATQNDSMVRAWIRERATGAEHVVSVCNGAYILAATGLLDGLTATTFYGLIDGLAAMAPNVKVVKDQRFVDNGKIITTAGLSSGIDGALHVVSRMLGKTRAQMVALNMEYDWNPDSDYARAAFADGPIRRALGPRLMFAAPAGATVAVAGTAGDAKRWELEWRVQGIASREAALEALAEQVRAAGWMEAGASGGARPARSWKLRHDGSDYTAKAQAAEIGPGLVELRLETRRLGGPVAARTLQPDRIVVRDAIVREMPESSTMTSALMVIENRSGSPTALVGASTPLAQTVELHRMEMADGAMRMSRMERIPLPVGTTELSGPRHLMLIGLQRSPRAGEPVELVLEFENGIRKTVRAEVRRRAERADSGGAR